MCSDSRFSQSILVADCQASLPLASSLCWQEAECSSCSGQNATESRVPPLAELKLSQGVAERWQGKSDEMNIKVVLSHFAFFNLFIFKIWTFIIIVYFNH